MQNAKPTPLECKHLPALVDPKRLAPGTPQARRLHARLDRVPNVDVSEVNKLTAGTSSPRHPAFCAH